MADVERPSGVKQDILKEARERFKRGVDWEAMARARFRDDVKFAEGDAYNNYQWPGTELDKRDKRPSLTINRVRQHNLDILNDARQSQVAIKVRPLRGGASYDSAEILDGVIKHIEYISNADAAYQHALKFAVQGGIGWIRIATDYVGDDSFDQEIFIRPIKDPLSVMLDPDIIEQDGSDARWGFVFTEMPKDEFDKAYPKLKETAANNEIAPDASWVTLDHVRIAEYFRCVKDEDKLLSYINPDSGERETKRKSEMGDDLLAKVIDDPDLAQRSIEFTKVEHFTIVGDQITEEKIWPGKYIPLLRCIGEETVIDGQMDRKGHTRCMLDQQRMVNYSASGFVEYGALQTKVPWIVGLDTIEETQGQWETANTENHAFLGWKEWDDEGRQHSAPIRPEPPSSAPVYLDGFKLAIEQMYLVSGQNQADFGQPSNERSGKAIDARKREGDKATYHYLDNQSVMIRFAGKQIIDLFPHIYDTARTVKYRDDAGNEGDVQMDPNAPQHFQAQEDPNDQDAPKKFIMNPKLGVYDVQADVGPSFATQRQEAFSAFSTLLGANKELFNIVGDVWMRFADIPGAQEAAERLRRMVPAQALGGPNPEVQQLQAELQKAQHLITQQGLKLEDKSAKNVWEEQKQAISAYKAQSDRLTALSKALGLDPQGLLVLVREVLEEAQQTSAGGGALTHIAEPIPGPDQIHPDLGGQMQPPPPHTPPVDPNPIIAAANAPEPAAS
jgi:hypothetical protein